MAERGYVPTTQEAAQRIGCTPAQVRWLCGQGRLLGAYRRGRDWWIPTVAIDRLLAERAAGRPSERTPA